MIEKHAKEKDERAILDAIAEKRDIEIAKVKAEREAIKRDKEEMEAQELRDKRRKAVYKYKKMHEQPNSV